jgi:hypothetical protein
MKCVRLLLTILIFGILVTLSVSAQIPPQYSPCSDVPPSPYGALSPDGCAPNVNNLTPGEFQATAFLDGCQSNLQPPCQSYGDPDGNVVSLYGGAYGNHEVTGNALTHYTQGTDLASQIQPLCTDGTLNCPDAQRAIIFLFLGFSNCDIEICGGNSDAYDGHDPNRNVGQPCATRCRNPHFPGPGNAWNDAADGVTQQSFLYQLYHDPLNPLVGSHVFVFNGALGQQTLDHWDPTDKGYFWTHNTCDWDLYNTYNPECNYYRVQTDLATNSFSEKQVQAIFIKTSDSYPQCDLKDLYCNHNITDTPDAYQSEIYLGDILRYLKCCTLDANHHSTGIPRYPNLKQVFVTSRIYGGYANGNAVHTCLMTEPFAYEEGFGVQRLIVARIDRNISDYAGDVRYPESAPWVDWGPYLWASGTTARSDGLAWCNGQFLFQCHFGDRDVRYGDLAYPTIYWGDFTHPALTGLQKVANQLVNFVSGSTVSPFVSGWITK